MGRPSPVPLARGATPAVAFAQPMRRGTLIMIVVLFVLLVAAGIAQIVLATGDGAPLEGPTSPGQLPSLSLAPSP
jgi:hypothetical protein